MAYDYSFQSRRNNPFYRSWDGMMKRCNDPKTTRYERWGGRGIKVCDEWKDFQNFYTDMINSYTPGLSIDRIDNDGDYSRENCRWSTPREQAMNRSSNRHITHNGVTKTMIEWSELAECKYSTFRQRLYVYKWDMARWLGPLERKRG